MPAKFKEEKPLSAMISAPKSCLSACLGLLVILAGICISSPAYAVSASPELIDRLKASGELQKIVDRLADARAKGVWDPRTMVNENSLSGEKSFNLSPQAVDTFKAVVILVDFSDNLASSGNVFGQVSDFQHLLFSFDSTDGHYSMSEFFRDNSYGKFYLQGTVVGWYRMPQTYAYYVDGQNGFGTYPRNAQRMAEDAITAADPGVNYAEFDNDGNGSCDGVFVVHAGMGAEETGSDYMIWSHSWSTSYTMYLDGIGIRGYTTEPEELSWLGLVSIGVFAHEYGHFLGLPDLYDTDYSSSGVGSWSLMSGGSWNVSGQYPAFLDPWCKKELNFINPTALTYNAADVALPASVFDPSAYRIWTDGLIGPQYFLVENRQKMGNDKGLPGSGLLIWHIDETIGGNWDENHPLVAVEQADGRYDLEAGNNGGDLTDVWSTSTKTEFNGASTPNSNSYVNLPTKTAVWEISASDSIMSANLDITNSRPRFELLSSQFSDAAYGNNNDVVEVGETVTFTFTVTNPWETATGVTAVMSSDNSDITFGSSSVSLGTITGEGGLADNTGSPMVFTIPATYDPCIDSFYLAMTSDNPIGDTTFGFELHVGTPEVLVVDDDNDAAWEARLTAILQRLRIPYDVYSTTLFGSPSGAFLDRYSVVMWLTGNDRPDILSTTDIAAMKTFMDHGGNLFLTGQSICGRLSVSDPTFLNDYLKASFNRTVVYPFMYGVTGSDLGDGIKIRYASTTNQTTPQVVDPIGGAVSEFTIPVGGTTILSYRGDYHLVLATFGYEALSSAFVTNGFASTDTLMARIIRFFDFGIDNSFSNPNIDTAVISGELSYYNVVNHTPVFSWSVSDTTSNSVLQYQAQVGTGTLCLNSSDMWDSGVITGSDSSITYTGASLQNGQSYIFRVRVYNGTDWSNWRRIAFHMNRIGNPGNIESPRDDVAVTTATPELTVSGGYDPDDDPLTFDFEVYADAALTSPVTSTTGIADGGTVTSWTVDVALAEDQEYFWRSRASDGYEPTAYTPTASFYVNAVNQAPAVFSLAMPVHEQYSVGLTPVFVWHRAVDSDPGDAVAYTLRVTMDSLFGAYTEFTGLADTSFAMPAALPSGGKYFWKVVASDQGGGSTWSSETFAFFTGADGCCLGNRGNIDGDETDEINIADLLYFVEYQFGSPSGPEPICFEEADVDGSGELNIADIVYLVEYQFGDPTGPAPVGCP